MKALIPALLMLAVSLVGGLLTVSHKLGEILVATRTIKMKPSSSTTYSIEALRSQRWEVIKKSRDKAIVTFGPTDPRRFDADYSKLRPKFEVEREDYLTGFVQEEEWPAERRMLALRQPTLPSSSPLDQCAKLYAQVDNWLMRRPITRQERPRKKSSDQLVLSPLVRKKVPELIRLRILFR